VHGYDLSARFELHGRRVRPSFLHLADATRETVLALRRWWWLRLHDVQRDAAERRRARARRLAIAASDRVESAPAARAEDFAVEKG
jgi:hypothetical protein